MIDIEAIIWNSRETAGIRTGYHRQGLWERSEEAL